MPEVPLLTRHDSIVINRPYGIDVDDRDWLWEGTSGNRLIAHHLQTRQLRVVTLPQMQGKVVYTVFHWQGRLVLEMGAADFFLVYDPQTGACESRQLPGPNPIAWYGLKLPNDKLLFCERGNGRALIFDRPDADPRVVPCPFKGDYAYASLMEDGLLYTFMADPARVVRFDPASERFIDEKPLPWPEASITGRFSHHGVLYGADSIQGRFLRLDLKTQQWKEPLVHPDCGKIYGFIGTNFVCNEKAYFCLSTYCHRSKLNRETGGVIVPKDVSLTIDGRWSRFMERMIILDPRTESFDYLIAPPQPDGIPLLCYAWSDGKRYAVTGIVVPTASDGGTGKEPGPWLIAQG